MWRHPILQSLLTIYVAWGAWHWFTHRPLHARDGILALEDPRQTNLDPDTQGVSTPDTVQMGRWLLTVRADYQIRARVLAREDYRFDSIADLVPEDLALGWGPMSDSAVIKTIEISQSNRFYYWRASSRTPISKDVIIAHSANTHVIPANKRVARELAQLRAGQVVTLSGKLVDGRRSDGRSLKTSLVRTDTGPGACEVMLVNAIQF